MTKLIIIYIFVWHSQRKNVKSFVPFIRLGASNGDSHGFFSGSAGAGMSWHWESYVDKNDLWFHFGRFNEVIMGIDPVSENFITSRSETDDLRIYTLKGNKTVLLWLRDKNNTWQTELRDGKAAGLISGLSFDLKAAGTDVTAQYVEIYDPWADRWSEAINNGGKIVLPDFKRSLVLRITH